MMQLLFHVSFFLLCCLLLLSPVLSLQCGEEQYAWPFENSKKCCAKCAPGTFMTQDPDYSCHNECEDCNGGRYMETYNVKTHCDVCDTCSNPNMELKKNCSVTENTVCGCEAGYRCKDQPCTVCVKIPSSTPPPSTTAFSSESEPIGGGQDMVWFLVIPAMLCGGIIVFVATKIKPCLHWIRGSHGIFHVEKPVPQAPSKEAEEMSWPVQEVCEESQYPDEIRMELEVLKFKEV
ncbi:CD27 antigen isoform X1 [Gouania willdenowi]|uniref:CD27 antigen isoform X1 n=1 Tax=Gouania willdenowi TaxID=441366 RepID=UPI001056D180|nr:CD27 antigen isoform X1 [Gouania willdenowi]